MALGETMDTIVATWQNPKVVRSVFAMGEAEANAVINLVSAMPDDVVNKLQRMATMYGLRIGPITHAGLGAPMFARGKGPKCTSPALQARMINDDETLQLMTDRLVDNWSDLPPALRKSATAPQVNETQYVCRGFQIILEDWAKPFQLSMFVFVLPFCIFI